MWIQPYILMMHKFTARCAVSIWDSTRSHGFHGTCHVTEPSSIAQSTFQAGLEPSHYQAATERAQSNTCIASERVQMMEPQTLCKHNCKDSVKTTVYVLKRLCSTLLAFAACFNICSLPLKFATAYPVIVCSDSNCTGRRCPEELAVWLPNDKKLNL